MLPLVLGSLLLIDGIGKLPLAIAALREQYPGMIPLAISSVLPIILGTVIVINPFATVRVVVMVFGARSSRMAPATWATVILEKRAVRPAPVPPSSHPL